MPPSAKTIVRLDGTFLEVNSALCVMTGYKKDDLIGMTFQKSLIPTISSRREAGRFVGGWADPVLRWTSATSAQMAPLWVQLTWCGA